MSLSSSGSWSANESNFLSMDKVKQVEAKKADDLMSAAAEILAQNEGSSAAKGRQLSNRVVG